MTALSSSDNEPMKVDQTGGSSSSSSSSSATAKSSKSGRKVKLVSSEERAHLKAAQATTSHMSLTSTDSSTQTSSLKSQRQMVVKKSPSDLNKLPSALVSETTKFLTLADIIEFRKTSKNADLAELLKGNDGAVMEIIMKCEGDLSKLPPAYADAIKKIGYTIKSLDFGNDPDKQLSLSVAQIDALTTQLPNITKLNLVNCKVDYSESFIDTSKLRNLKDFRIGGLTITDATLSEIAKARLPLKELDLYENRQVTGDGLLVLAQARPPLEILDIRAKDHIEAEKLATSLRSFKHLTSLTVEGSNFNNACCEAIAQLPLSYLLIQNCENITDEGIQKLEKTPLVTLGVGGSQITTGCFSSLDKMPLKYLLTDIGGEFRSFETHLTVDLLTKHGPLVQKMMLTRAYLRELQDRTLTREDLPKEFFKLRT